MGPSLDVIPETQLPLVRTVLQRYRAVRIVRPLEPVPAIATTLAAEILPIWEKANIPTASVKVRVRRVQDAIKLYSSKHKHSDRMKDNFQVKLNALLDLKPKSAGRKGPNTHDKETEELKKTMKVETVGKKRKAGPEEGSDEEWEQDFNFYLDQSGERIQRIGIRSTVCARRNGRKERNMKSLWEVQSHQRHLTSGKMPYLSFRLSNYELLPSDFIIKYLYSQSIVTIKLSTSE